MLWGRSEAKTKQARQISCSTISAPRFASPMGLASCSVLAVLVVYAAISVVSAVDTIYDVHIIAHTHDVCLFFFFSRDEILPFRSMFTSLGGFLPPKLERTLGG
jgi:hypothetical protein